MCDKNVSAEDDHMLSITADVLETTETTGDTKINLDLDEDVSGTILHDNLSHIDAPSVIAKESSKKNPLSEDRAAEIERKSDGSSVADKYTTSKDDVKHLWVSNINHQVKANELKKHFGKYGKVVTAKVLTNGENFYGYISMATAEQATECMRMLDKSTFVDQLIHVSKLRPNMKDVRSDCKISKPPQRVSKTVDEERGREGEKKRSIDARREKDLQSIVKQNEEDKKTISNLERKLKNARDDISRLKRKLDESEQKNLALERNLRTVFDKTRAERRYLNQEKEDLEKLKKSHRKQMAEDKLTMMKELDEVKALRNKLQNRLDNFLTSTPRQNTSRSPGIRNFRASNEVTILSEDRRYRDSRNAKRPRTGNTVKQRIVAPSPPMLTEFDRRGHSRNQHFTTNRAYYDDEKKHMASAKPLEFRQRSNFGSPFQEPRGNYSGGYPANDANGPVVLREPFIAERFAKGSQKPPQILGPSRDGHSHYAQEYGKPYSLY